MRTPARALHAMLAAGTLARAGAPAVAAAPADLDPSFGGDGAS